jgi:chemotaxis protein MotB
MNKAIQHIDDNPYGLSIGDLMASLLLIIILVLCSVMLRLEVIREQKSSLIEVIDEQENIKRKVLEKLKKELSKYDVVIDKTGVILVKEGILFDFGKYDIKPSGEIFLKKFIPEYVNILLSDTDTRVHISQILIEGHTDNIGTYENNLELSLNRANSVAKYIFSNKIDQFLYQKEFQSLLSANGRSFVEPRYTNATLDGRAANRRVEFKFRLKDWDIIASSAKKQ